MPHVIVMHSLDIDEHDLLSQLQEAIIRHETVDPKHNLTFALPITEILSGDRPVNDLLHILVRMKSLRSSEAKREIVQSLHDVARTFVNEREIKCCVSVDIQEIDPETYLSSYS